MYSVNKKTPSKEQFEALELRVRNNVHTIAIGATYYADSENDYPGYSMG